MHILMLGLALCQAHFFFANWLPVRFCHRDTRASANNRKREKGISFSCLLVLDGIAPALALHLGQQQLLLVPRFFTTLRSRLGSNVIINKLASLPPSGSGPSCAGILSEVPEISKLTLQCLLLKVFGSRSAGSFLQTANF